MCDVPKAISLYEQAWKNGVTIASFELGDLYEHGVRRDRNDSGYLLAPDEARAWTWYQKGADAGEPTALARFGAEEDRAALTPKNPAGRTAHLLSAFNYYASAAERARLEDWPDATWRDWRYRRASIARVLAREGTMEEVAGEYGDVRKRYAPHPTVWQRVASSMTCAAKPLAATFVPAYNLWLGRHAAIIMLAFGVLPQRERPPPVTS